MRETEVVGVPFVPSKQPHSLALSAFSLLIAFHAISPTAFQRRLEGYHGHCCLRSLAYPSGTIKPTLLLLSGFMSGHLFSPRKPEKTENKSYVITQKYVNYFSILQFFRYLRFCSALSICRPTGPT